MKQQKAPTISIDLPETQPPTREELKAYGLHWLKAPGQVIDDFLPCCKWIAAGLASGAGMSRKRGKGRARSKPCGKCRPCYCRSSVHVFLKTLFAFYGLTELHELEVPNRRKEFDAIRNYVADHTARRPAVRWLLQKNGDRKVISSCPIRSSKHGLYSSMVPLGEVVKVPIPLDMTLPLDRRGPQQFEDRTIADQDKLLEYLVDVALGIPYKGNTPGKLPRRTGGHSVPTPKDIRINLGLFTYLPGFTAVTRVNALRDAGIEFTVLKNGEPDEVDIAAVLDMGPKWLRQVYGVDTRLLKDDDIHALQARGYTLRQIIGSGWKPPVPQPVKLAQWFEDKTQELPVSQAEIHFG